MELLNRLHRSWNFDGVQSRISTVSERLSRGTLATRLTAHRRRLTGVTLVLISLAFGIWGYDLAEAEALEGWIHAHPPSPLIWKHALESQGYRQAPDPKKFHKAYRSLPSTLNEEGSAWASADTQWIAVYQLQSDSQTVALYCLECEKLPQGWQPVAGRGWQAFDPVLALAEQAAGRRKPAAAKRRVWVDPMEVRY